MPIVPFGGNFSFQFFFLDVISNCQAFSQIGAGNFGCSQKPILIKVVALVWALAIFIHNPWQSNLIPRGPKGCIVNATLDERTPLVPLPSNTKKEIRLTDNTAKRGNAIIFHLQIPQTVINSVSSSFASLITN